MCTLYSKSSIIASTILLQVKVQLCRFNQTTVNGRASIPRSTSGAVAVDVIRKQCPTLQPLLCTVSDSQGGMGERTIVIPSRVKFSSWHLVRLGMDPDFKSLSFPYPIAIQFTYVDFPDAFYRLIAHRYSRSERSLAIDQPPAEFVDKIAYEIANITSLVPYVNTTIKNPVELPKVERNWKN